MALFRDLEQRFHQTMDELYSTKLYPSKDSNALHPIIIVRPNDPNRSQGIGNSSRLVPVGRVLTDQERMTKFLTNPAGLRFMIGQQLLQTGNPISETRLLNPLFINLNLGPYEHFKRQLRDQTNISLGSAERSPASTPEIGLAGRLQKETAQSATVKIINEPNPRRSLLAILGATRLGNLLTSGLGIGGTTGTLGINERPEFDVGGKLYPVLLREGYGISTSSRVLNLVADALNFAGSAAGIIGLPGIFRGVIGGGVNPIPDQTDQMRYFITDETNRIQYLATDESVIIPRPILLKRRELLPSGEILLLPSGVSSPTIPSGRTLIGGSRLPSGVRLPRYSPPLLPQLASLTTVVNEPQSLKTTAEKLTFSDQSLESKYLDTSEARDKRLDFVKNALKEQANFIDDVTNGEDSEGLPNRGVVGGINLSQLKTWKASRAASEEPIGNTLAAQEFFSGLEKREIGVNTKLTAPGYYHDTMNLFTRIEGRELPSAESGFPQDYITVTIYDKTNDRLEPFRAFLSGLSETVTSEVTPTRYIGRIEKNLVYAGAGRSLGFALIVHAWSPIELQKIWDKVNFITGLAFPSGVSEDGFLLPPIVELTIGDLYKNQPGYFTSITHRIADDVTWEIEPGAQVPRTVEMSLAYDIIEKDSMVSSSEFYNFGVPRT